MDMANHCEQALLALNTLATHGGYHISDAYLLIFKKKSAKAEQHSEHLTEIYYAMFREFFHCAAQGLTLVPERKVTERFSRSIQENYPEANEVFLKLARTFWTLRVLVFDLQCNYS